MPHIAIDAYDLNRVIRHVYLHAEVEFSREYFVTPKANEKLKELQEKLDAVISEYFDVFESDLYDNHEWNCNIK